MFQKISIRLSLTFSTFYACIYLCVAQSSSVFPENAWGVYSWTGMKDLTKQNAPLIKGCPMIINWGELEPANGKFEFDKVIRKRLEAIDQNGFYTFIKIWVAPVTNNITAKDTIWGIAPRWLFNVGVPLVDFPNTINPLGATTRRLYPYYLDSNYKSYFHRMISELGKYLLNLPPHLKKRILYVQSAEGSTGDGSPYKGKPLNSNYNISEDAWSDFRLETWEKYKKALSSNGVMEIPLLTNYDANNEKLYQWMLTELPMAMGLKNGMFSHGYQISDAQERLDNFNNFKKNVHAKGKEVFARGEMDGEYKVYGWSTQNLKQAMYWSSIYATYCGLTMWNLPTEVCKGMTYADAINFFNKYANDHYPNKINGAFIAFYRGLDASDTTLFSQKTYGRAIKSNLDRYTKIAHSFSGYGANQADAKSASGGGMENRKAKGFNDVGWKILKDNFQRHITQMQPNETSTAWWQIDSTIYGRYSRGFEPSKEKNTIYFDVDDLFINTIGNGSSKTIKITVIYRDSDEGSWELKYPASNGKMKKALEVKNAGNQTDSWKTKTVLINDANMKNNGPNKADFVLVNSGKTNCRFHLISIDKI